MKRLVIDARMIAHAGIGVYLSSILAHFKNTPFHISLIISKKSWEAYPKLWSFDPIFYSAPIYSVKEQLQLPRLIPRCDLFWSPHFNIPRLPIRCKKRLVTICDLYHLDCSKSLSFSERFYAKSFIKKAVTSADKVITISEFSKSRLIRHLPKYSNKIEAIPLGPGNPLKVEPTSLQVPTPFFLFVGSVKPHKNLSVLLNAFEQLIEWKQDPLHLVIAGKISGMRNQFDIGTYLGKRPALAKKVHVLGEVSDQMVATLYQRALGFIFPSLYEGWGLPPLEAMQLGCPVIASNAASIPEACGDGALYFNPTDTEKLASHLSIVASSEQLRQDLIQRGKQQTEKLSWKRCAERHLQLLDEISLR